MTVAVVMTAWNPNWEWLWEARRSVWGQLRDDDEIVTVDDGSDQPAPFAEIRIEHVGVGPASNAGISAVPDYDLIARLDADDRMMSGTLDVLRAYLESHPHVDVVSGAMHYIRPDGTRFGQVAPPVMHASPTHQSRIVHSGCMFRRELWEKVGGYPDRKGARGTDWHFWERCEAAGARFTVLPHFVIERRIHPDSHSFKKSKHLQDWYRKAQI